MTGAREPERSDDGRWVVVDGRRWRATDPALADPFRKEMVNELMAARREVGQAKRAANAEAERTARDRVHAAKVALGERGAPWWQPPSAAAQTERLGAVTLTLARHRAPDRTICPSDVARAVGGDAWRSLMDPVREVVRDLARASEVEVTQHGEVLDPDRPWKGPVRIRAL
jgi:hypothetical protein